MSKLTPKQTKFCEEYLISLNSRLAAIAAGYSVKTAATIGGQNLLKLEIQERISELRHSQQERTQIEAEQVVEKLWKIANFDIRSICETKGDELVFKSFNEWDKSALDSLVISGKDKYGNPIVKMESRLSALDTLAKYLGMYSEFNIAVACLKKYGLVLQRDDKGDWGVKDINVARIE